MSARARGTRPAADEVDRLLAGLEPSGIRLGLEPTRLLLERLGAPQERFPALLIAGSNGKGSTAALLASILRAAGYRTGLYTSPHLERVEERLRIDGGSIDRAELAATLTRVLAAAGEDLAPPTYFEALTAAAFAWFARRRVDVAVVEVGLGGRLDATNLCRPVVTVICQIGREHREFLGESVAAIATEKAGILRPDVPVVVSTRDRQALAVIAAEAARLAAPWVEVARAAQVATADCGGFGPVPVALETARDSYRLELPLLGAHQLDNLAAAVLAAEALAGRGWEGLSPPVVAAGVAACRWPGRLERVEPDGAPPVLLDAAHNPAAAATLAAFLDTRLPRRDLLFGILADKDWEATLAPLVAGTRRLLLTRPASSRARSPLTMLGATRPRQCVAVAPVDAALDAALAGGRELVVCGSIYLVGEMRQLLRRRFGVPPPP